ncbi:MAG: hypothetical protein Q8Q56_03055 [Alphaproteobacteria bacterium]|nr:hypothetical protein [Alphaproteobacteria bacterium]
MIKLCLWLLLSVYTVQAGELVVFNTGQGSCNLFVPENAAVPMLYDAGSSRRPIDPDGRKIDKVLIIDEIVTKIHAVLPYNKRLVIVISHGDSDHYNYIPDILKGLDRTIKFFFFLGGKKAPYSNAFKTSLNQIPQIKRSVYYAEDYLDQDMPTPEIDGYEASFLARLALDDKNSSSLVLRVRRATAPPSSPLILFMGDATDVTTAPIVAEDVANTLVLLANHHGSATEGSNNQAWVDKTCPDITVFSAAASHYGHPDAGVAMRYHASPRLRREALHEFSYSGEAIARRPSFATYHAPKEGEGGYFRALTRKALFNTMNEGTMTFKLGRDLVTVRPDKPFFAMFPLRGLRCLDLSNIELVNTELVTIAPKLSILYSLETFHLYRNRLSFSEGADKGEEAANQLDGLLQKIGTLVMISLWENVYEEAFIEAHMPDADRREKLKFEVPAPPPQG